ncbi:ABC transporter substrate-binding protein [Streptomyces sp. HNM0645]|uniref:ABC transporter substrate-binding protein n=1 Tax=Streptomyces sp. HNM0645 TaxID=2782343 RepID=UPI0024B7ADE9|nr:ABC transporter substrate-binding protein [Streptomyces sp. HNM0645]MDI9889250.1 ABC transporter substrate-binding protein [Streptomyces sp. HNM0645]
MRTGPSDLGCSRAVFSLLKERQSKGTSVERLASHIDGKVVADVTVSAQSTDLSSQAQAVRASDPEVVLTLLSTPQALALNAALDRLAYRPPALMAFGGGHADRAFPREDERLREGVCSRFAWSSGLARHNPAAKAVADLYRRTYEAPMNDGAARAFTAVMPSHRRSTTPGPVHRPTSARGW